jgi:predicted TIM-barrel fold metal-dependent hydrolase
MEPVIDASMHLWDQARNPVAWLTDRTMVRDVIGDYDSLPDTYALPDYVAATAPVEVRGVVWSDAGAADTVAAARWVVEQDTTGVVTGLVALADPGDAHFERTVRALREVPKAASVRIRLVASLGGPADETRTSDALALLDELGLVATLEVGADQLELVGEVAPRQPTLQIVLDHFGWPADLSASGRRAHLGALSRLAEQANVVTRIDAIGAIFGKWDVDTIHPWLIGVVDVFGPQRCMLGSDMPIETLRSTFADLYAAYDAIFADRSDDDRRWLFADTARQVYGR